MGLVLVTEGERIKVSFGNNEQNGKPCWVEVQRFTSSDYNRIVKSHTTTKGTNRQTGMPKKFTDDNKVEDDLLCLIVQNLVNVDDGKGGIAETNRENILLLPLGAKTKVINVADQDNAQGDVIEAEKKTSEATPST